MGDVQMRALEDRAERPGRAASSSLTQPMDIREVNLMGQRSGFDRIQATHQKLSGTNTTQRIFRVGVGESTLSPEDSRLVTYAS